MRNTLSLWLLAYSWWHSKTMPVNFIVHGELQQPGLKWQWSTSSKISTAPDSLFANPKESNPEIHSLLLFFFPYFQQHILTDKLIKANKETTWRSLPDVFFVKDTFQAGLKPCLNSKTIKEVKIPAFQLDPVCWRKTPLCFSMLWKEGFGLDSKKSFLIVKAAKHWNTSVAARGTAATVICRGTSGTHRMLPSIKWNSEPSS